MKSSILSIALILSTSLTAQVGIGTTSPRTALDVNGTTTTTGFTMTTTPQSGAVLTSNAVGSASWQVPAISNVVANLAATGVNIPAGTTSYIQTGSSITLPPGKYAINVSMLMRLIDVSPMPNSSSFWLRSSFSDSNSNNPTLSSDIVGGKLASGNLSGSSIFSNVTGTIIINNQTTTNKTYYYVAGNVVTTGQAQTLGSFGGSNTDENRIIGYRIN